MNAPRPDLETLIAHLAKPGVLPGSGAAGAKVIQTHISAVFLTDDRAFKLKKPVDFGFLDFSTPDRRAHFCREEYRLNRRLAPSLYEGLAPVWLRDDGVEVGTPAANPPPADELLVVMNRLPQERMMDGLLEQKSAIEAAHVERLARVIAAFHGTAETDDQIAAFGARDAVGRLAIENFEQTERFCGSLFDPDVHATMRRRTERFLDTHGKLMDTRVASGRVRDCHGDLHSPNICFPGDDPVVYDCIEFSSAYRCSDVASEIAFMAMDLEFRGHGELADAFVAAYVRESEDELLEAMLPFYRTYRAMVRAKIAALTQDAPEVDEATRTRSREDARRLFELAERSSLGMLPPMLVVVGGVASNARGALVERLRFRAGMPATTMSAIRKLLSSQEGAPSEFSDARTSAAYQTMSRHARRVLDAGAATVVSGYFLRREHREPMLALADSARVPARFVEIVAPEPDATEGAPNAREEREPWDEMPSDSVLTIDATGRDPDEIAVEVLEWLGGSPAR
jgi:hypothetical protein